MTYHLAIEENGDSVALLGEGTARSLTDGPLAEAVWWRVRGFRGPKSFYDYCIPFGAITEEEIQNLLRCMTAKANLSYDEIISAHSKQNTRWCNSLLDVRKIGHYSEYECGTDPRFTAIPVDAQRQRLTHR
jgi:hypothetical protein